MLENFVFSAKKYWFFWMIVFVINACLMTVEIVAGRLLAPWLGVSIVPWASVIAVVMVAMAFGYRFGGWCVSRYAPQKMLVLFLMLASLSVFSMPFLAAVVGSFLTNLSLSFLAIALILSVSILFLPSFLLAAISPLVFVCLSGAQESIGRKVGSLNGSAALGSIVGTLLAGFVWIMWFAVPTILFVMACLLFSLGVITAAFFYSTKQPVTKETSYDLSLRKGETVYYFLAFISGFALMSIEVLAARALAPSIGVSIFSWTGIIAAVLLAVTAGNIVGGKVADREQSRLSLGRTLAWLGVAVLLSTYVVTVGGPFFSTIPVLLPIKIFFFALLAFFPCAFAMAMVSPQLARLAASSSSRASSVVASLWVWNTLGGLLGTVLTGFWLISWFGTRGLLLGFAVFFVVLGFWFTRPSAPWDRRLSLVFLGCLLLQIIVPATCLRETQYYCIQLVPETQANDDDPSYILRLDHLVHSYVHARHPENLGYGYEKIYAHLLSFFKTPQDRFSALFIGGGGYVFPRYLQARYPAARSVVAEIDPGVTRVNQDVLGLKPGAEIQTISLDARIYLSHAAQAESFDFVFGDAFNDFSVPYHLTTLEFHRLLKSRMSPNGVYALNIIDDARYGQFVSAMILTLRAVWKHVYVAPGSAEFEKGRNTIVLLATDQAFDQESWSKHISLLSSREMTNLEEYRRLTQLLSQDAVDAFLAGHPVPALTDAFAPTDRYLMPVFTDAY